MLPSASRGVDVTGGVETRTGPAKEAQPPLQQGSTAAGLEWPGDLPCNGHGLRALRVAIISDESTFRLVSPECSLIRLARTTWRAALTEHAPHLLLVQGSAALGSADWGDGEGGLNEELLELVGSSRQRGTATALWDDEAVSLPVAVLHSASGFDRVFTTELERIPRYRAEVGAVVEVHWLPRAVQATLHHPIADEQRVDELALVDHTGPSGGPAEPAELHAILRDLRRWRPSSGARCDGSIAPSVARHYRFAFVGSRDQQGQVAVEQCALELLAGGALVASTIARGLRVLVGDLVACSDSGPELVAALEARTADRLRSELLRMLGLRRVLGEHTWQDRFVLMASHVWGVSIDPFPEVVVLSVVSTEAELDRALLLYTAQNYPRKRLCLVGEADLTATRALPDAVVAIAPRPGQDLAGLMEACPPSLEHAPRWLAVFDVRDHHGPDYLTDLAIATRFSAGRSVGKPPAGFRWVSGELQMPEWDTSYSVCPSLAPRSSLVPESQWRELAASDVTGVGPPIRPERLLRGLATDPFHYCQDGADQCAQPGAGVVDVDPRGMDTGTPLAQLLKVATRLHPDRGPSVRGQALPAWCVVEPIESQLPPALPITVGITGDVMLCESQLPEQERAFLYAREPRPLRELGVGGELRLHLVASGGLGLQVVALFLDGAGARIGHLMGPANRNLVCRVPGSARSVRFGVRVAGTGRATIESLVVGSREDVPPLVLGRSRYLLLTDQYPAATDLYRNAFVHRRVKAYQSRGVRVDVFAAGPDRPLHFEEFDGVNVTRGSFSAVEQLLWQNDYEHVLVHFLTGELWSALDAYRGSVPVTAWVHGAEVQPWWRRSFNLVAPEQREAIVWSSAVRREFWRGLMRERPVGLRLVFVSRTFAMEVFDDLGIDPGTVRWSVIHNPIDTVLFEAGTKPSEARRKVWSIRPYASEKYANDLTVEAILEMSVRPEFEDMEFLVVGDGPLFESTTAPLAGMRNVVVQRGFLTQEQMADLHRQHGVFLVPTRWDSQGVSRDEAMSMGLVPITNAVAAVPEFVDDTCAVLCPAEDSSAIVDGLLRLYHDPRLFQEMSRAAMLRVRLQSDVSRITAEELAVFTAPGD